MMLNGKHCTSCFVHENLEWFTQKKQLEVEIAQKQWELKPHPNLAGRPTFQDQTVH